MTHCDRRIVFVLTGLLLICWTVPGFSQTLNQLKVQLQSTDLKIKSSAIYELKKQAKKEPHAKQLLIDQLAEEIALKKRRVEKGLTEDVVGEGKGELFARLLAIVANFKDPATIELLVESLETGTGVKSVRDTFIHFADTSTFLLVQKLKNPGLDKLSRSAILNVMVLLSRSDKLSLKKREVLRKSFGKLLEDKYYFARKSAIKGLGSLGNGSDVKRLEKLAANDPYSRKIDASFRGGKKGKEIHIYPIREEAQKALKKLRAKQVQEEERKKKKEAGQKTKEGKE